MRHKICIPLLCAVMALTVDAAAKSTPGKGAAPADLMVNVADERADSSRTQAIHIDYRVNRTEVERDYMNNAEALAALDHTFANTPAEDIAYIVIMGNASPEGSPRNNDRLAEQRAASLKNYIIANCPGLSGDQIVTIPRGENWEGLASMVANDGDVPYREELLRILSSGLSREEQKRQMTTLGGGQTYKYLQKNILPALRGGVSSMIYFKEKPTMIVDTVEVVRVDTVYRERTIILPQEPVAPVPVEPIQKRPFYIAAKTNLLSDAALLPNLSVEIPFGRERQWSAAIGGSWSWWDSGSDKYNYHRIQMVGVEVRRWFANRSGNPLNGWYAGVYGYGGDYDIRLFADRNSDIGQQSRWSYSAGVTAGYAMPVARRLNLEFGVGIGYFGGKYKKYDVSDCADGVFPVLGAYRRNYFGLTKASVSLVWQICGGVNRNNRKGVARW